MQTVTFMPSPNFWQGRSGQTPKYIILHGTAGGSSASNIAHWFANPASQVSAHYVIGLAGEIVCCVKEEDSAWANGILTTGHDSFWSESINPNLITISIEHLKQSTDNSDALTVPQQASSFALISDICSKWQIPMRAADASGGITGHFSMDPVNRSRCPGSYPWPELWAYLGASTTPGVPQGWRDDGTTLYAPNNVAVKAGFRQYVLSNQWPRDNWPLEEEHGQNPLELSNPSLGGGTQQVFRWTVLEWTPAHGVFVAWVGEELLSLRAEVTKLQAK